MSTKSNPGQFDCYANADPDEEMFVLLARDRHGPALVRLWALMREKEGEDPAKVAEARECADRMELGARQRGKVPLPLDGLLAMAAAMRQEAEAEITASRSEPYREEPLKEGDIVVAGRNGVPARLVKIFNPPEPEPGAEPNPRLMALRGKANVMLPRAASPLTVDFSVLRRALPEEVQAYTTRGGV